MTTRNISRRGFSGSDEFGAIRYETASKTCTVGDALELIVPHCDPAVNEYDRIYGTRKDRVEVVWPIAAPATRSRAFISKRRACKQYDV